jgi:hypothetical protein
VRKQEEERREPNGNQSKRVLKKEECMNSVETYKGLLVALLVVVSLGVFPVTASALLEDQGAWIDNITQVVAATTLTEGTVQPYLGQLQIVRAAFRFGDEPSVVSAMNRFMEMLGEREYGIPADTASWVLDYCYRTIPAKYHDAARHQEYRDHMDRLNGENGFGEAGG